MELCIANIKPAVGNKKKNLKKMESMISEEDADMYVFGEMALTGYTCRDEFRELAEEIDGPSINAMKEVAMKKGCYIIFGMPLKDREGVISNASVMVHPDGRVNAYRKSFLANFGPFEERFYFSPGREMPVFETRYGKIGMCICYDVFFPELVKGLVLKGADMIVCISASPTTTREFFEKVLPARAIENTAFVAYSNIVGTQENLVFWGGGQVYSPRGELLARGKYLKEGIIKTDVDFGEIEGARASRPTLRDTKADIFSEISKFFVEEHLYSGYMLVGLKMGKYASSKMRVGKVTVNCNGKIAEDIIGGIILYAGITRDKINLKESEEVSASFSSSERSMKITLKEEIKNAIDEGVNTKILSYIKDEEIFDIEE
ncbi:MAG: hypothetical protein DRN33_00675 [Thermoplasmata archaeon]|nr:MAG: carbon-nitrogen hydrolase family protein [Thermoplasmata archaeon]RLF64972.1 MAG: hypothetical protein DRN33_00675 [Thermoplasmata archaeon]